MGLLSSLATWACLASTALAMVASRQYDPGDAADSPCEFDSATAPSCWGGDFDLSTNYYDESPDTGVEREYWFDVVNSTMAPDGVERMVLSINGTVPGPTIFADWGDTIVVHVRNLLENNGTSIHFHGLRQNHTTEMDGVASVTQCPTPPGDETTYRFKATQYGTSWYHSHFQLQAWNGLFGGIVINGPASAPYDEDLGTLFLNDWFYDTADQLYAHSSTEGPPRADNGLINGTNVTPRNNNNNNTTRRPVVSRGRRFETRFERGRRYRIRLVNAAIDTMFRFAIDGHGLTVISTDLVPIVPYAAETVNVGIGQRYDVVVVANGTEASGNYWLRAIPSGKCGGRHANAGDIRGVVRYGESGALLPTTRAAGFVDNCADEPMARLVPVLGIDAGRAEMNDTLSVGLQRVAGWFKWTLNNHTFVSNWSQPTLEQATSGLDDPGWTPTQQIVELKRADQWVYFIIENHGLSHDHPLHLHGHDVQVLAQGPGRFNSSTTPLLRRNSPRRDVVMLPAFGFVVLAFVTDNPGVWLMHCHIGWHTGQGFALQLVERADEIRHDGERLKEECERWEEYASRDRVLQEDSGI